MEPFLRGHYFLRYSSHIWSPSIYFIVNKISSFFPILSQSIRINSSCCITYRKTLLLQECAVVNHLLQSQSGGARLMRCGLRLTQYIRRHFHLWRQFSHFVARGRAIVKRELLYLTQITLQDMTQIVPVSFWYAVVTRSNQLWIINMKTIFWNVTPFNLVCTTILEDSVGIINITK